jgi:hypothetical protein
MTNISDEIRSDPTLLERAGHAAEEQNRRRFAASIQTLGKSAPFRKDGRSREKQISDVLRLARLAKVNRGRRMPHSHGPHGGGGGPGSASSTCESGWSSVVRAGDTLYPGGSTPSSKPALALLPPDQMIGYAGTSAIASTAKGSISIGAVIGDYCDLEWTPPDQRVQMGVYETATMSASWWTFYNLSQPIGSRAPNALMAKAAVLRTLALPYMIAGDPTGPGGGLIWCYATAALDVYIGLNLTGTVKLPHATYETCLWNRMGEPIFDSVVSNNVNGNWDTQIDVLDDGDVSNPVLSATIGGTNLPDTIILVAVSVNVCCLRYPGSSGFAGVSFQDPTATQLVITPSVTFDEESGIFPETAPIQVQSISLCGI